MGKMTADELRRAGEAYRSENNGAQKSPVTVSANTEGSGNKMTASELRQAGEAYRKANGLSDPIYMKSPATVVDKYSTPSTQPTQAAPSTQPTQAAPAGASSRKQSEVMQEQVGALKKQRDDAAIKAGAYMRAGNMQQQAKEQQKIANKAAIEYENAYTQWKNQRNAEAVEDYNPDENKFKAGDAALSGVQNAFQSMGQYAAAASSYLSGNQEAQAWEAKRLMDSGVSGTEAVKRAGLADKREIPITDYKTQAELRHEKNVASVGAVEGGALQLVNTISNMVPSLVANAVLPGSGLPVMAASVAGNKYADSYEKYGNTDTAFVLGSAAGGASMLTEQFGGLYGSLGKSAAGQAVAKKLMAEAPGLYNLANSVGGKWLRDALSEGIEEGAEDVINYAIEKSLTGDSDEMDNFGYDMLLGALAGGVFGGGNAAMRSVTYSRVGKALNASPSAVAQQVQEGLEKGAGTAPAIYAAEVQKNPSNQMVGRLYEANRTFDRESGLSKIQGDITQISAKEIKAMVSDAQALAQAAQKLNVEATPQAVATAITEAQRTESIKTAEDSVGRAFAPTVDNPVNEGEKAYNSALAGVAANQGVAARINNDPAARQAFSQLTGVQFSGNTAQDIAAIEVATQNIAKSGKQAVSQAEYAQRVAAAGEQAAAQFDADMQAQAEQMQRESEERWLSVEQNTITDVDGKRRIKEITNTDVRGNTEIGYKKAEIPGSKKKAVADVNNAAKYLGKTIVWYEGALQVNGQYRLANGFRAPDGTIYVNINSRDPLMVTFGHEMFHDLVADGKYSGMIDTLVENPDYADMVKGMMNAKTELYERNGIELDPNAAAEEVAADISGDLLGSRDMLEYIGARNTEAATGIKGFLNRILKKLKGKPSAQEAYNRLSESQKALLDGMEGRTESTNSAEDASVKHSLMDIPAMDSTGRELSAEQREYFFGSKVVDAEGRLKPVYHGSPAVFTEFSPDFMSQHGSSEGQGFYFTDYKPMAEGYQKDGGQLLEGYLDIKKPLSDSEITLTRAEVKKLLQAVDPTGDEVILNYDPSGGIGYPSKTWYNRALDATVKAAMEYSDSDSEILAEIANGGAGAGAVLEAARNTLGYDGYIVEGKYDNATVYVAFDSSQFKNIDNTAPTESKDIRYSLMDIPAMDSEYSAAVESGNMQEAQRLVDEAAKAAGAILDASGRRPLHLYHGTNTFGYTKFRDGVIYATPNQSVAAGYGRTGYAKPRLVSDMYVPDDGTMETLIKNAKNVLDWELQETTVNDRQEAMDAVKKDADSIAALVDKVWTSDAVDAMELTEEQENALYNVLSLPSYISEVIDDIGTYTTVDEVAYWISRFNDGLPIIRSYIDENRDSLKSSPAWDMARLILGYDLGDFAIDAEYRLLKSYEEDLLTNTNGSFVSADVVREEVEKAKDIGSYTLYGFAGDRPLVIDGGGAFWANVPVDVWGGTYTTDDIVKRAKDEGYTSVLIKNINDVAMNNYSANIKADIYAFFSPEQVKSADPVTYDDKGNVIPLSERFNPDNPDIRYSLMDDVYLDAVKRGDMTTVQQMVDEAAKAAGYETRLLHGTSKKFTKFEATGSKTESPSAKLGIWLSDSKRTAESYSTPQSTDYNDSNRSEWTRIFNAAEEVDKKIPNAVLGDNNDERFFAASEGYWNLAELGKLFKEYLPNDYKELKERGVFKDGEKHIRLTRETFDKGDNYAVYKDVIDRQGELLEWVNDLGRVRIYPSQLFSIIRNQIYDGVLRTLAKGDIEPRIVDAYVDTRNFAKASPPYHEDTQKVKKIRAARSSGKDGIVFEGMFDGGERSNHYVVFDPARIKSAAPVTYDDNGNVIPLSERFNRKNEDIRYSLMEDAKYMADIDKAVADAAQKANDELKAAQAQVKDLRKQLLEMRNRAEYAELQTKVTERLTVDPIKAKRDIGRFLRKNGITNDEAIKTLTAEIEDAFNSVYRGEKTDIDSVAKKVADTILKEATIADPLKAEKADIRKSLSQRTFVIGEQLRGDIVHKYGSLTNFRKKYGNIIRIKTRENANVGDGVAFDVAYSELQSEFPGIFRDAETEWETFENTVEVADYAKDSERIPLSYAVDEEEFARSITNQLTDLFWIQKGLVTEADKAKAKADAATENAVAAAVEAERQRGQKEIAANDRWRDAETKLLTEIAAAKEREKAAKARAEFMAKYDALAKQYRADLRANNQQAQEKYNEKLTEAKDEFNRRRTQDRIDRVVREDQAKSKARLRAAEQKSTTTDDVAKVLTEMPKKDKETFKAKIAESWRTFKRQWINTKDELERFGNEVGDSRIMYAANNVGQASAAAQYSIGGAGQYDLNGKKIGNKNLMQVFDPAEKAGLTKEFYTYLLHEHNVDRMSVREKAQKVLSAFREELNKKVKGFVEMTDENIATAAGKDASLTKTYTMEQIDAAKRYKQLQAWAEKQFDKPVFGSSVTASDSRAAADKLLKEHPEFEKWAKDVYAYLDGLMEVRKQGGLVSADMAQRMKELYPHYVPTYRDMPSTSGGYSNPNSVAVNSTIKSAKGGNQDIMPLIDSIARQTLQTFSAAKKNILGNMLYEDAMDTTRDISEYIQSVTEEGDLVDLDADSAENLKNTLRIWVDGKPVTLHMSEAMADGFRPIEQSNSFGMKALRSINSTFKKLVTQWNPVFIVRNFVRDAQSALYFTHYSNATFIKNYGKAVKEIATNGKYWQLYQAMGGKGTTYYDPKTGLSDRHHFKNGAVDKVAGGLNRVIDILSFANEAVEQYPRLAEFISTMEDTGDVQKALYNAADITTNFGRGGFAARKLNASLVPFFNPGMQGLSKNIRNVIDRRGWKEIGQLISRLLINGVAPGIIMGLLYDGLKEDDDYKELSNYIKDSNILIKIGDDKFIKVPMGREPSVITAFTNRMWRWLKGEPASSAFADYPSFAIEQLAPNNPLTNNIFAGITAMSTNKNWYGGDIVSSYMEEKPDYLQYDESTDAFSIWLGEITRHGKNGIEGLSPKKVNYLIDQYSGFIGDWVLPALSKKADVPTVVKAFVVDSVRQNRLGSDFYDALDEAKQVKETEFATAADDATYSYLYKQSKAASEITKQIKEIYNSGEKTRKEKMSEARDLLELRNEIYRNALLTVGTYEETAKSIDSADSDVVKREANRKAFGAEYALKTYNKDVGEKAAEYVAQGVTYDQYYAAYFATRGITGDKDENGKTITNSASRKKKEAIDKAVPNATTKQKHLLYEAICVSEKVW